MSKNGTAPHCKKGRCTEQPLMEPGRGGKLRPRNGFCSEHQPATECTTGGCTRRTKDPSGKCWQHVPQQNVA